MGDIGHHDVPVFQLRRLFQDIVGVRVFLPHVFARQGTGSFIERDSVQVYGYLFIDRDGFQFVDRF